MKIDLQRAVEVLSACGYECEELYATHNSFQAGAASRDAEIADLKSQIADWEWSYNNPNGFKARNHAVIGERDQLREQVALLREALLTCSAGDFSTGHVIYPSFDEKLVEEALAATEPKKGASQKPAPHACRNTETTSI